MFLRAHKDDIRPVIAVIISKWLDLNRGDSISKTLDALNKSTGLDRKCQPRFEQDRNADDIEHPTSLQDSININKHHSKKRSIESNIVVI